MHIVIVAADENTVSRSGGGPIRRTQNLILASVGPLEFARCGVERIELSAARADVDHAFEHERRGLHAVRAFVAPELFAGGEIERIYRAVIGTYEHFVCFNRRRGFDRAACLEAPAQLERFAQGALRHASQILAAAEHRPRGGIWRSQRGVGEQQRKQPARVSERNHFPETSKQATSPVLLRQ